ncbi:YdeI/OmpD-associated family protein [Flavihumibacter sp.]|uniref:YdeI/OmpD-associated family protein n=1 Tax=Flavihumibacter sp. TaxID=1913981 RepID=UPI002FC87229|nr:YdeI/OmpD-associated family protein [Flavihumibacter sediminis]
MVRFTALIEKFGQMGEKTGWTYVKVPAAIAVKLKPGCRKSFRVRGKMDDHEISGMAMIPMGEGDFILALKTELRRKLSKRAGDMLKLALEEDKVPYELNPDLLLCLKDEPDAFAYFNTLASSHKVYFSKWIDSAKTEETKASRIAEAVIALSKGWGYPEMLRARKA